jgi:hypothetical protein
MATERELILGVDLQDAEIAEIEETSHAKLLANAFEALTQELDTIENTEKLTVAEAKRIDALRKEYSKKLLAFWAIKRNVSESVQKERLVNKGRYQTGDESLTFDRVGETESYNGWTLLIRRETNLEKDAVSIIISGEHEIGNFLGDLHIKSEIKTEATESPNLIYEVSFRDKLISNFRRSIVLENPKNQRPYLANIREIDFSTSGIDSVRDFE